MNEAAVTLHLAPEVEFIPVAALEERSKQKFSHSESDVAISNRRSRVRSKVVSAELARLVESFKTPATVADAVLAHAKRYGRDPHAVLVKSYPALKQLLECGWLAKAVGEPTAKIEYRFEEGVEIEGFRITRRIQLYPDSEVYQGVDGTGRSVALKIARPGCGAGTLETFAREAAILRAGASPVLPQLLVAFSYEGCPGMAVEWKEGAASSAVAARINSLPREIRRSEFLRLFKTIVHAYALLHDQGIIHGDVHPRNVLVGGADIVHLIDFGYARMPALAEAAQAPRCGVEQFLDPELAAAKLASAPHPAADIKTDQYAVAAVLYFLLTGASYIDFSFERPALLRQIVEVAPRPILDTWGAEWPAMEAVLRRALAKDPAARFESMHEFHTALAALDLDEDGEPRRKAQAACPVHPGFEMFRTLWRTSPQSFSVLAPAASLNHGCAGVASACLSAGIITGAGKFLALADRWSLRAREESAAARGFECVELGITAELLAPVSIAHHQAGVTASAAYAAQAMCDAGTCNGMVQRMLSMELAAKSPLDLQFGLPGYGLGVLAMVRSRMMDEPSLRMTADVQLARVLEILVPEIGRTLRSDRSEKVSLGMAHGLAGALSAAVRIAWHLGRPLPPEVTAAVAWLLDQAVMVDGCRVWPRATGAKGLDLTLSASWCNGSAGYALLWATLYRASPSTEIARALEACAEHTARHSAPARSLCCGVAGRAIALSVVADVTREKRWTVEAERLVSTARQNKATISAADLSLYSGELGFEVATMLVRERCEVPEPLAALLGAA